MQGAMNAIADDASKGISAAEDVDLWAEPISSVAMGFKNLFMDEYK